MINQNTFKNKCINKTRLSLILNNLLKTLNNKYYNLLNHSEIKKKTIKIKFLIDKRKIASCRKSMKDNPCRRVVEIWIWGKFFDFYHYLNNLVYYQKL